MCPALNQTQGKALGCTVPPRQHAMVEREALQRMSGQRGEEEAQRHLLYTAGTRLGSLCAIPKTNPLAGMTGCISLMENLRLREVRSCAQEHTAVSGKFELSLTRDTCAFQVTRLQKAATKWWRPKVQMSPTCHIVVKATIEHLWRWVQTKGNVLKRGKEARDSEEIYLGCVQYILSSKHWWEQLFLFRCLKISRRMGKFTEEILSITNGLQEAGRNYLKKLWLGANLYRAAVKYTAPGLWV